ncbi:MAG: BLUF domain-containing protein [Phycisphaerales bacterium]
MKLYTIIYISTPTERFKQEDLEDIAATAQKFNREKTITGLLLYSGDHFMQVLEGDYADLTALFANIEKDPRHHHIEVLMGAPTPSRQFPAWSMGVVDISASDRLEPGSMRALCDQVEGARYAAAQAALGILERFRYDCVSDTGVGIAS